MIAFGICIGTEQKFQDFAAAGIARHGEPDAPIAESRDNTSIFTAYNEILDAFQDAEDLEALVLLHEDTEIRDPGFCAKVRAALTDPEVAVVGAVGARGVTSLAWWEGEGLGRCAETRGVVDFGGGEHDADSVDGLLMVLSPWAVRNLRFDAERYTGFHAYDVDFCFTARAAGKRVRVVELDVFHHTKGGFGDEQNFHHSNATFRAKWFPAPASSTREVDCPCCATPVHATADGAPELSPCPGCGSAVTFPVPAPPRPGTGGPGGQGALTREQRRREARVRVDWLQLHLPQGALLEVGAGTGEFALAAQDEGYTVVALEADARAARECEQLGVATLAGTIPDLRASLRDHTLDAVVAWHVLPHLPDPAEFLRHTRALLKAGGRLLLEVPDVDAWTAQREPLTWLADHPGHLHHFSDRGLRTLLEREGFRVLTSLPFTTRVYDSPAVWARRASRWRQAGGEPPLELLRVVAEVR